MSTLSTPNLGLIKPDKTEPIPNWPGQYEQNADTLDKVFRFGNPIDFTPEFKASTSDPTLGTGGYIQGKLIRLWPWLCIVKMRMYAGTAGFAGGSGSWHFTIPEDVMARMATGLPSGWPSSTSGNSCFGSALLFDNSSAQTTQTGRVQATTSGGQLRFFIVTEASASATTVTATSPFTWTNEDKVSLQAYYVLGGT